MHRQKAKELLDCYLAGNASSQEENLVNTWYNRTAGQRSLGADQAFEHLNNELWEGSRRRAALHVVSSKQRRIWPIITVAASLLALVSLGVVMWTRHSQPNDSELIASDIPPGGYNATLTLADGRTIDLS